MAKDIREYALLCWAWDFSDRCSLKIPARLHPLEEHDWRTMLYKLNDKLFALRLPKFPRAKMPTMDVEQTGDSFPTSKASSSSHYSPAPDPKPMARRTHSSQAAMPDSLSIQGMLQKNTHGIVTELDKVALCD